jgi:hypothetical protein
MQQRECAEAPQLSEMVYSTRETDAQHPHLSDFSSPVAVSKTPILVDEREKSIGEAKTQRKASK